MKKNVMLEIMLTLMLIGTLTFAFNIQPVRASGTIYIRADGSVDPPDAPISSVDNVTYTFTDNINDSIVVERDNIVVDGACYALEGTGTGRAIDLTRRSNVTIKNMKIKGFDVGIYLSYSSNNVISGNNITNTPFRGIFLHRSSNNSVIENMFAGCGLFVWASYQNTMEGNTVNGKLLVYLENISGYIVKDAGQVILVNCNNTQVKNLNLSNTTIGVQLWNTKNTIVADNNITNNYYGIYLGSSSNNNSISGNNITNNGDGIWLDDSSNYNVISGNNITYNSYHGIYLDWSSYNNISGNNINNTFRSIYLYGSSYNNISGNNITNDTHCGICLISSSNNVIVHNNFIGNAEQVYSYLSVNVWDDGYPSGGNYWSDYTGEDANGDGIGDIPYIIDENNTDRYPLMTHWTPPEHELVVSITVPVSVRPGSSALLYAIVTNQGLSDESNVELMLLINGTMVDSKTISLLQAGDSYTFSYLWTPTVEGTYNITAYAHPVPGETSVENNQETKHITVAVSAPPGVQVGVKAGDWIKVDYTITGAPPGTTLPLWLKVEFLSVEGTNVTVRVTMRMSDGTEQNATLPVDVVAGGQAFGLSGFVIPANLTTGDIIFMSGYGNVTIEGETTRTYAGASRTVVYASFSQYGTQLTYYWDKRTGVMVEASTTSGTITGTGKATETNMWQPELFGLDPILLYSLIILTIIVMAAVAFLAIRRKKKPPEEVENPQS